MNLPTKITVVRIVLIPVFVAVFLIEQIPYNRFIATGIFILASLTDWLDGYLARKMNLVTDLGKFLDPIADKLLVACALVVIVLDSGSFQIAIAVCTMITLSREFLVSAFRIIASSKNVILAADKLGKIKTVLQMISLILLLPSIELISLVPTVGNIVYYASLIILAFATIMTVISGANYIIKNRSVLYTQEK